MASSLEAILAHVDQHLDAALERLTALLRIPSISTDPAYAADCQRAADWLVEAVTELGFEARKYSTPGHPMVVAHTPDQQLARVLFYGHYDVQPVDPLALWVHDPFDPQLQDTPTGQVIRGRGAADDKGQLLTFVEACRAWRVITGQLPSRIALLFEGEEESGSPSLVPFLNAHAAELQAEVALICDTNLFDPQTPAITTQLRGLMAEEIVLTGANIDLHSGTFGGAAMNPARVLAQILADLHDDQGRVTLAGFYDGVPELPADILEHWAALNFDAAQFLGAVGLVHPAGEVGRSVLEMRWSRPTLEINGLNSGYTGAGFKTVLPATATAKVSCRLVGQQDPEAIRSALRAHVTARLPADCTAEFIAHAAAPAVTVNANHPACVAARQALSAEWPNPAVLIGFGGTIPIAGYFQQLLGMEPLLIGFGRDDDQIHAPNEQYHVESFRKGIRSWVRVLDALSK